MKTIGKMHKIRPGETNYDLMKVCFLPSRMKSQVVVLSFIEIPQIAFTSHSQMFHKKLTY